MPSAVFWPGVGGGTDVYRCRTPGAALTRLGWDVSYVDSEHDPLFADVVVVQRVIHEATAESMRTLKRAGCKVVYDIDDWYDDLPGYNPASRHIAPRLADLHDALGEADLITTSTPELAEGYSRFGPTLVLPNYLDPDIWANVHHPPRSKVHVGYMGSLKYHAEDVNLLRPWLAGWLADHPDVEFVSAGDGDLPAYLDVRALVSPKLYPDADNHMRPYGDLPAMLAWFDIGLVPLTYNRFNQAKSWCKGMEYSAAGAAVVASPSREYRRFIQPGVNGYLARKDWPSVLDRALDNLDTLKAGARRVVDGYFIDRHIHRWVEAYESVRCLA